MFFENLPLILTIVGIFLAVVLPGIGSAKGASVIGKATSALISEQPEKFGQSLVLYMMHASQGLYGFIVGFLIFMNLTDELSLALAVRNLGAGAVMGIAGIFTAIHQSSIAAAGIQILAKKPEHSTKGVLYSAMIETYAIFAFVISVLIILV
ncbi:MAG: V-type ATP synthase subunit K [Oscillospiraceae bacterium]|jgi:V/A-type H+-transporting ATPase subunit K|nr:V-type ATP synthase subunit K [Oscillospiraceae bacterium]